MQDYVPGYHLRADPQFDAGARRVAGHGAGLRPDRGQGRGDYLPDYAGNLDIITAAAARVGDLMVAHRLGVDATWKSSAELGEPDPLDGTQIDRMKAGV